MKRLIIIFFLLVIFVLNADWIDISRNRELVFESRLTDTGETSIRFSLDGYQLERINAKGSSYVNISYQNEGETLEEGKPSLPQFTRLLAVDETSSLHYEIVSISEQIVNDVVIYPSQPLPTESGSDQFPFTIDEAFYQTGGNYPQNIIQLGDIAIMRDFSVAPLIINPFRYDPVKKQLKIITNLEVSVDINSRSGQAPMPRNPKLSKAFEPLYRSMLLNYDHISTDEIYQQPSYLFIYPNNSLLEPTLDVLVEWKHQMGYQVEVANTSQTGTTFNSIKSYIQNLYNTAINPPEFICLIGDAGIGMNYSIPTDYFDGGEGDQGYVRLDGNDILADAFIGRLSISSNSDLQNIIAKIYNYEKTPFMQTTDWYQNAFMLGDPSTSLYSVVDTKRHIAQMIETTNPHYDIAENYSGNWVGSITSNFNSGISYFNYRGFGGVSGFQTYHIDQFTNGRMLPVCVLITCNTGDFVGNSDSYSERFLKAGTATSPKGGIAAISTATGQTHTTFNNCVDAGIYYGIFVDEIYHMGGALNRGKLNLYQNFSTNPANCVYQFSYWNNLMGDPGMKIWTNIPQEMIVNYDNQLNVGADYMTVEVTTSLGAPLADAWVTALMGEDDIFATGWTDENGMIILPIEADMAGTASLTVTKHNYIPHLGSFDVGVGDRFVKINDYQIDDDNNGTSSGNNNNTIDAGENIELSIELSNLGNSTANNVIAALSTSTAGITISDAEETYGNINAGAAVYSADDFDIEISPSVIGGTEIQLDLQIEDSMGNIWFDHLFLLVEAANLQVVDYSIENDPNGVLDPGDTAELVVTMENLGFTAADNIYGTLSCQNSFLDILDDTAFFGNVATGGQAANTNDRFQLSADTQVISGTSFVMELNLYNASGFDQIIYFDLVVGTASVTDPTGSDGYGYYIYDDGDIGYIDCPEYNWIEISSIGTELPMNDSGNEGDLETITLPISFKFYGETYNQVTVCTNGFIVPGQTQIASYMNWEVPGPLGPSPIIAPFWDDLKYMGDSGVYWYHDTSTNSVIIQWHHLRNDYNDDMETFQAILYDSFYYPTALGDSPIKFQYKDISNCNQGSYGGFYVQHGGYATVGIEDHTSTVGVEYTFNNIYPGTAKTLQNDMALLVTGPPIQFQEPYLVLGELSMNDPNGNGQADFGEDIDLFVVLNNLGEEPATNVSATISTTDPNLSITTETASYATVPGNGIGTNITPFELEISEDCPDGHIVPMTINVSSDEANWELYFTIELNAPILDFHSVFVDDGANNILDPGETADIYVSFINSGGAPATNVLTQLAESDPYITLNSSQHTFGVLSAGNVSTGMFNVTADASAPIGHLALIDWNMSGDTGFTAEGDFNIVISQVPVLLDEDFSSGTYPPNGWTIMGSSPGNWSLSSTNNANGSSPESKLSWSPSFTGVSRLVSPVLNTAGSSTLDFEFMHYLNDFSGNSYSIGVSTTSDGGNTWNSVWEINPSNNVGPELKQLTVSTPDVGSQTFQIALVFDGNSYNINYWYIDNIHLEGGQGTALGFIEGTVSLTGGTGNVEDVIVTADDFVTSPNASGYYIIPIPAGTYDLTAELDGYSTETQNNVSVVTGQTTTVDFTLDYLESPQNLNTEVVTNDVILTWEMPSAESIRALGGKLPQKAIGNQRSDFIEKKTITEGVTRDLTGFKIYRNNSMLIEIDDPGTMTYLDEFLNSGDYSYYVTAVYDNDQESDASNTEQVNIILLPPTDLQATPSAPNIELNWSAPVYSRNLTGYNIYRDDQLIDEVTETTYLDQDLLSNTYTYYVQALYGPYTSESSNEVVVNLTDASHNLIPQQTNLIGNYPNPFNPETLISFSLHETDQVELTIYNIKGEVIKNLVDDVLTAAYHQVIWDGSNAKGNSVASGIYFYKLKTDNYSKINKMILLK